MSICLVMKRGQAIRGQRKKGDTRTKVEGGTDLYLGPQAQAGKQGNRLATIPGKGYFAILRLYAPTEAALNKSWKPGDIERVK
jgi:hypothetical protein